MGEALALIDAIAPTDLTVLLQGETGVGKEIFAREIHVRSARRNGPFVKVHCAALPASIFESEVLGHESGAFTGASRRRIGKFELANAGTIFLDEIGELPLALQAKLLQVLEDRSFHRLGGNVTIRTDLRVVCASNRSLEKMVANGEFRRDLFFRIHGSTILVPPLRERRSEIPLLLQHFLHRFAQALGRPVPVPSLRLRAMLSRHPFPGNVRELENLARRFVLRQSEEFVIRELLETRRRMMATGRVTMAQLVSDFEQSAGQVPLREVRRRMMAEAEREAIQRVLIEVRCNRRKAARMLRVSYSTLITKIRECGLEEFARATAIAVSEDQASPRGRKPQHRASVVHAGGRRPTHGKAIRVDRAAEPASHSMPASAIADGERSLDPMPPTRPAPSTTPAC
jgi:transcriptional regulator with PAS, ATPase and Fis domain